MVSLLPLLVLTALTGFLTFFLSAAVLRPFYGGSRLEAFWTHLLIVLGRTRGYQIVDDGRIVYPDGPGPHLGPRLVIIRPGNAAILERSASRRTAGPSIFTSERFEYVKKVYDLREQQRSFVVENALTCDLVPIEARVTATFRLDICDSARCGPDVVIPPHPYKPDKPDKREWQTPTEMTDGEKNLLLHMPFAMPNWQNATQGVLEKCVRRVIRSRSLTELLSVADLEPLEAYIAFRANIRTSRWGVRVIHVILENLQPKPRLTEAAEGRWVAITETDTIVAAEQARASGMRNALIILASGYEAAKRLGMSGAEIHREVLRRTLECVATDPATKMLFTPELGALLASLHDGGDDAARGVLATRGDGNPA
jgi:hypothetical protein